MRDTERPGQNRNEMTTTAPEKREPVRTVSAETAFALTTKTANNCTALAPEDWVIIAGSASDTADMLNSDRTMYAGWGIKPVNTAIAGSAHLYPPPLNDPELYSGDPATTVKAYANVVIHTQGGFAELDQSTFRYTTEYNEAIGPYSLRSMESDLYKGIALFHSRGFPGDGQVISYIEPMHLAITKKDLWEKNGLLVAKVAASIRCTTQLQPSSGGVDSELGGGGDGGGSGEEPTDGDGYNPQLGTEYVHDSQTDQNYLVSPSDNWSDSGPDGPGYYKQNGNDYTKLEPGRSD